MSKKADKADKGPKYANEISQMMFVTGEVSDPLPETVNLVEDIVKSQVVEIILQGSALAHRRGSRHISPEDLIFLVRHDRGKVNRLRSFLSWKEVRKNAKANDPTDATVDDVDLDDTEADKGGKVRRRVIKLPWELVNAFSDAMNAGADSDSEDDDEVEAYNESVQRLRDADAVTRAMSREEYVHYSECRQASFTYRKGKRFRDWANMSTLLDVKPNDDIIDILGFLTFEMVSTITEAAMKVKNEWAGSEAARHRGGEVDDAVGGKRKREADEEDEDENAGAGATGGLFSLPKNEQTPLKSIHIQEAFRRMQYAPKPLKNFKGHLVRSKISLI